MLTKTRDTEEVLAMEFPDLVRLHGTQHRSPFVTVVDGVELLGKPKDLRKLAAPKRGQVQEGGQRP